MQRYIEQLIEDLHKATWNLRPPHELWEETGADPDDEVELEDMSFVEEYMYGDKLPISDITGIEQEQLPPPEQLTQDQKALLAAELEKLLQFFHFCLDFPADYPTHLRYSFIRDFWKEEHVPMSFGETHIEFCSFEEENCPFPGYCNTCREVTEQMEFDNRYGTVPDSEVDVEMLLPSPEEIEDFFRQKEQQAGDHFPDEEDDLKKPGDKLPY